MWVIELKESVQNGRTLRRNGDFSTIRVCHHHQKSHALRCHRHFVCPTPLSVPSICLAWWGKRDGPATQLAVEKYSKYGAKYLSFPPDFSNAFASTGYSSPPKCVPHAVGMPAQKV
jgi:hypothetical protein